jgi:hypothetical protein
MSDRRTVTHREVHLTVPSQQLAGHRWPGPVGGRRAAGRRRHFILISGPDDAVGFSSFQVLELDTMP